MIYSTYIGTFITGFTCESGSFTIHFVLNLMLSSKRKTYVILSQIAVYYFTVLLFNLYIKLSILCVYVLLYLCMFCIYLV